MAKQITLLSWNVNGIRAAEKKGFIGWLEEAAPDLISVQETKASPGQLSQELLSPEGYYTYWSAAEKKGYSGVAVFTRHKPLSVTEKTGNPVFDREGRILILEFEAFVLANVYFPNGKANSRRLSFKLDFYREFLGLYLRLRKKYPQKAFILCGDLNTAHQEIDLARPGENSNVSGFLSEERDWIDRFIEQGLVDTFRIFHRGKNWYTWWDLRTRARQRNVGWRIDYFFIDKDHVPCLKDAFILKEVRGSDHCPCGIRISC